MTLGVLTQILQRVVLAPLSRSKDRRRRRSQWSVGGRKTGVSRSPSGSGVGVGIGVESEGGTDVQKTFL